MNVKQIVEDLYYERTAYRTYRTCKPRASLAMVEIIGPPGVGKSFTIAMLRKQGVIATDRRIVRFSAIRSEAHAYLLKLCCERRETDLKLLKRWANKLHYDALLSASVPDRTAVIDEGVSHQFPGELVALHDYSAELFKKFYLGRGLIYLSAPQDQVLSRVRSRAREDGKLLPYHEGRTDSEISSMTKKTVEKQEMLIKRMNDIGVQICMVDTINSAEHNCGLISEFLAR